MLTAIGHLQVGLLRYQLLSVVGGLLRGRNGPGIESVGHSAPGQQPAGMVVD